MEVIEFHKARTYAIIGLTLCFTVFLMTITGLMIVEGGIFIIFFIFIDCLILIPLGLMSFYFYYFKLWTKFVIDNEKFEIIGPHQKKSVYWSEFDYMRLNVKGRHIGFTQTTSRHSVSFKIRLFRKEKKFLRKISFWFVKQSNGDAILDSILKYSQDMGKDVILNKRYMNI